MYSASSKPELRQQLLDGVGHGGARGPRPDAVGRLEVADLLGRGAPVLLLLDGAGEDVVGPGAVQGLGERRVLALERVPAAALERRLRVRVLEEVADLVGRLVVRAGGPPRGEGARDAAAAFWGGGVGRLAARVNQVVRERDAVARLDGADLVLAVGVEGAPARLGQRGRGRGRALRGDEALDERRFQALRVGARGLERGAQLDDLELLRLARRGGLVEGARAAPLGLGEALLGLGEARDDVLLLQQVRDGQARLRDRLLHLLDAQRRRGPVAVGGLEAHGLALVAHLERAAGVSRRQRDDERAEHARLLLRVAVRREVAAGLVH